MQHKSIIAIVILFLTIEGIFGQQQLPPFLGKGYNILIGNPKTNQHDPGYRYNPFIFANNNKVNIPNTPFFIPDAANLLRDPSCSYTYGLMQTHSMSQYTSNIMNSGKIKIGGGFTDLIQASFTLSLQYKKQEQIIQKSDTLTYNVEMQCMFAYVQLKMLKDLIRFDDQFIEFVQNAFLLGDWSNFIQKYGTHYSQEVGFGCKYAQHFQTDTQMISRLKANSVNVNAGIGASFYGKIDANYDHYRQQRSYVQHSSTMTNRYVYLHGGAPPAGQFNPQVWFESCLKDPAGLTSSLKPWSDAFKILPSKYFIQGIIDSYDGFMKTYCKRINCQKPSDRVIPVYRYNIEVQAGGCGTSTIHCQNRGDTRSRDGGGLYYLSQMYAHAGAVFDNYMFVFRDHLGKVIITGDNQGPWSTILSPVPSYNINGAWNCFNNPDCHTGAHEVYINGLQYFFGGTKIRMGFQGDCGGWSCGFKSWPDTSVFRVCGIFGSRQYQYRYKVNAYADTAPIFCKYIPIPTSRWGQQIGQPFTDELIIETQKILMVKLDVNKHRRHEQNIKNSTIQKQDILTSQK